MGIALQPVPPEMARVVTIVCNDCEERDEDRRWHFLGVQCNKCGSFNTTVEATTLIGHAAAAFLGDDAQQQQQQQQAAMAAANDSDPALLAMLGGEKQRNNAGCSAQQRHGGNGRECKLAWRL